MRFADSGEKEHSHDQKIRKDGERMGNNKAFTGTESKRPDPSCKNCHGKGFVSTTNAKGVTSKVKCFCVKKSLVRK